MTNSYKKTGAIKFNSKIEAELRSLSPSAIIELYELTLTAAVNGVDALYRYHPGTNNLIEDIKFGYEADGTDKVYKAFPCQIEGFNRSSEGTLPRPTFTMANSNSGITNLLSQYNFLHGKIQRIRTCKKFLNASNFPSEEGNSTADPDAVFEANDIWYIDRIAKEDPTMVVIELTSKLDLTNLRSPRRQVLERGRKNPDTTNPWGFPGARIRL